MTPQEIDDLLAQAPLPIVDVREVERRMQTAFGLTSQPTQADLLVALHEASGHILDLIACIRGYYAPLDLPASEQEPPGGGFKAARGILPLQPGEDPPEVRIRRQRDAWDARLRRAPEQEQP